MTHIGAWLGPYNGAMHDQQVCEELRQSCKFVLANTRTDEMSHTCNTTIHVSMRPGGCQRALDCTGVRVTEVHCMYADTRDAVL
jgi:hypothetical protein